MTGKQRVLGRDAIFAAPDNAPQLVEVPEWGGSVYVRGLSARERDQFEIAITDAKTGKPKAGANVRGLLVVMGVCDEAGARIFTDADADALSAKGALAMERVFDTIRHLSGMTDEDLSLLEGNSTGQSVSLPTA